MWTYTYTPKSKNGDIKMTNIKTELEVTQAEELEVATAEEVKAVPDPVNAEEIIKKAIEKGLVQGKV